MATKEEKEAYCSLLHRLLPPDIYGVIVRFLDDDGAFPAKRAPGFSEEQMISFMSPAPLKTPPRTAGQRGRVTGDDGSRVGVATLPWTLPKEDAEDREPSNNPTPLCTTPEGGSTPLAIGRKDQAKPGTTETGQVSVFPPPRAIWDGRGGVPKRRPTQESLPPLFRLKCQPSHARDSRHDSGSPWYSGTLCTGRQPYDGEQESSDCGG